MMSNFQQGDIVKFGRKEYEISDPNTIYSRIIIGKFSSFEKLLQFNFEEETVFLEYFASKPFSKRYKPMCCDLYKLGKTNSFEQNNFIKKSCVELMNICTPDREKIIVMSNDKDLCVVQELNELKFIECEDNENIKESYYKHFYIIDKNILAITDIPNDIITEFDDNEMIRYYLHKYDNVLVDPNFY